MYETKLIQTYLSLNKEERRLLKNYIQLHFVKLDKDLYNFFLFFSSKKKITPQIITKQQAFEYLYGKDTLYNDQKIRHLIWLSNKLQEQFIVDYYYHKNLLQQHHVLAEFYTSKQLNKYAKQHLNEGIELLHKQKSKDNIFYLDNYRFLNSQYEIGALEARQTTTHIAEINNNLNIYYIIELLKNANQIISIKAVSTNVNNNILLDNILNILPNTDLIKNPLINIYYESYLLFNNDNEVYFDSVVTNLKKYNKLLSFSDINNLYKQLINYCIRKHNQNIIKYRIAGFELYLFALHKKYLFDYNHISRFIFSNVVTLGLRLNRIDQVEQFIKNYKKYLENDFVQSTVAFNQAKLYYAKKEYNKAIKILMIHQFKDLLWNINMKHLLLKIYFETNEIDLLNIQLRAFKMYISRKNSIGYHQTYFNNIGKAFSILVKIKQQPQKFKNYKFHPDTPDLEWFNQMYNTK
jgi:hypothetical protein